MLNNDYKTNDLYMSLVLLILVNKNVEKAMQN